MVITDTLTAEWSVRASGLLARTNSPANHTGKDVLELSKVQSYTNGTGSGQASGWFASQVDATTGGISISMADFADPTGAAGDDVPTSDPEGLKLRGFYLQNLDTTNYVSIKKGTNGDTNMFSGNTDSIRVDPGGVFFWTSPAGSNAMSDGVDDEVDITANTATCTVSIAYIYG